MLWPDEKTGPWMLTAGWSAIAGRIECTRFEVRSWRTEDETWAKPLPVSDVSPAIGAEVWRSIPVGRIIATLRARQKAANITAAFRARRTAQTPEQRWRAEELLRVARWWDAKPAAGGTTLEQVADVYRRAWGNNENPTQAVADHFVISPSAAAKRVARARAAGLLPPTSRGRATAAPTPDGERHDG